MYVDFEKYFDFYKKYINFETVYRLFWKVLEFLQYILVDFEKVYRSFLKAYGF